MARTKKQVKVKEPVRLRFNELKDGRKSIYLDIYYNGRRTYQSLKLYLVPETDVSAQIQNANTLAIANAIKTEKILDLTNKIAGITDRSYKANMLFTDWMRVYRQDVEKRASASALIWVDRVTNELEKYDNSVTLAENAGILRSLLEGTLHQPLKSANNRLVAFFFDRLCHHRLILGRWEHLLEQAGSILGSKDGRPLKHGQYSSALSLAKSNPNSMQEVISQCVQAVREMTERNTTDNK